MTNSHKVGRRVEGDGSRQGQDEGDHEVERRLHGVHSVAASVAIEDGVIHEDLLGSRKEPQEVSSTSALLTYPGIWRTLLTLMLCFEFDI